MLSEWNEHENHAESTENEKLKNRLRKIAINREIRWRGVYLPAVDSPRKMRNGNDAIGGERRPRLVRESNKDGCSFLFIVGEYLANESLCQGRTVIRCVAEHTKVSAGQNRLLGRCVGFKEPISSSVSNGVSTSNNYKIISNFQILLICLVFDL